jgi:hypothetical protein
VQLQVVTVQLAAQPLLNSGGTHGGYGRLPQLPPVLIIVSNSAAAGVPDWLTLGMRQSAAPAKPLPLLSQVSHCQIVLLLEEIPGAGLAPLVLHATPPQLHVSLPGHCAHPTVLADPVPAAQALAASPLGWQYCDVVTEHVPAHR